MENNQKPPTQSVGVEGFKADLYASDIEQSEEIKKIEWHILIHLPKFQMFCVEISKRSIDNIMQWIMGFVQDQCYQDEHAFFVSYTQWHDQKGYWKQEDYFGKLL